MRTDVKAGESMMSLVSSMRRRSEVVATAKQIELDACQKGEERDGV